VSPAIFLRTPAAQLPSLLTRALSTRVHLSPHN
jgi:hypothetical protein